MKSTTERTTEMAIGRTMERTAESIHNTVERMFERVLEKTIGKTMKWTTELTIERTMVKTMEGTIERTLKGTMFLLCFIVAHQNSNKVVSLHNRYSKLDIFRPLPHPFVLYAPWTGGSFMSLGLGQPWPCLDLLPLLPLLFGIAFHPQIVLLSYQPIFLRT